MGTDVSSFIKESSHRIPSLCPINVIVTRTTNRRSWQPNPSSSKTVLSPCPRVLLYYNDGGAQNTALTCLEHFEFVVNCYCSYIYIDLLPILHGSNYSDFHWQCSFICIKRSIFSPTLSVVSNQHVLDFYGFHFIQCRAMHICASVLLSKYF